MRFSSLVIRSAALAVALGVLAPLSTLAQTFTANTGTDPVILPAPMPSVMKVAVPKHGAEKLLYGKVRDGVYTVDGMVAKVQLNYDVNGVRFLYMFVPGIGTAVISATADPEAVVTEARLEGNDLSFSAGDHHYMLSGIALANEKGAPPQHLYVKLDRTAWKLSRRPMVGFGDAGQVPYQWPGALAAAPASAQPEESQVIPPVPVSLLPSTKGIVPTTASSVAPVPSTSLRPALR